MKTAIMLLGLLTSVALSDAAQWDQDESTFKIARLYHAGELDKAEQAVQEHFQNDVHPLPDVWLLAGRVLVAQGKTARAIKTLERAAREFPKEYRIWTLFGEAHIRQGDEAEGLKALRRSLEINDTYAPTYLWLARASYGNPLQVVWLKKVLVLEPKDSPIATESLSILKALEEKSRAQPEPGGYRRKLAEPQG